jgi:hypothetical protein
VLQDEGAQPASSAEPVQSAGALQIFVHHAPWPPTKQSGKFGSVQSVGSAPVVVAVQDQPKLPWTAHP